MKESRHQDMITYSQESIKFVSPEMGEFMKMYSTILLGIKDKHMSVREIHDLYLDEETGKHDKTLNTIYRYLEKLEELGLVVKSGQRMTEGKRTTEALYCKVAKLIIQEEDPMQPKWFESKLGKEMGISVGELLSAYFNTVEDNKQKKIEDISTIIPRFYRLVDQERYAMVYDNSGNKELEDIMVRVGGSKLAKFVEFAAMFATLAKYPEMIEEIRRTIL